MKLFWLIRWLVTTRILSIESLKAPCHTSNANLNPGEAMKRKPFQSAKSNGHSKAPAPITRREMIKGVAGLGATVALSGCAFHSEEENRAAGKSFTVARRDLIRRENDR